MKKPLPPYRLFGAERGKTLVLQVREIGGPAAVDLGDLEAFEAVKSVSSPWGAIPAKSRLLLTPEAARFMLADGTITRMPEKKILRE